MKKLIVIAFIGALMIGCSSDTKNIEEETVKTAQTDRFTGLLERSKQLFGTLPTIAENPENVLTDEKVALGKKLFFDVRLSKDNTISCNSCHNLKTFGVDNLPVSPGNDKGSFGTRNSPTVLNAALHFSQFWDGRAKDVEEQAGMPILNPVEMAIPNKKFLEDRLSDIKEYQKAFSIAFPNEEDPINYNNIQNAIAAFERMLITPSPFDSFLAGNPDALTEKEKEGLDMFMRTGCITCHSGKLLGGHSLLKFGSFYNYWNLTKSSTIDMGRYEITKKETDKYLFKIPSLRNVAQTAPYFHDGSVKELSEAVKIMAKLQVDKDLSDEEAKLIVAFLNSLTGELPKLPETKIIE